MSGLVNKVKETLGSNHQSTTHDNSHTTTTGTGATATTGATGTHTEVHKTGPVHHNEMLNKVDPRVHETKTTTTSGAPIDPGNAAHVPPSVMQQHVGEPSIEHDYPHDSTHKRHSVSHQENHLMK